MNLYRNLRRQVSLFFLGLVFLFPTSGLYGQILTLTPSLSVSERYDDNIFQQSSNTEDDFVTTLTPGLRLRYNPSADTLFDLDYRIAIERFADHTDQNQISHLGFFRFDSALTRLISLNVRDRLVITEEQEDRVVEIDDATGLRPVSDQARRRTIRNRGNAALDVRIAPRIIVGLLLDSLFVDVDVPDEVDEFRYTVGLNIGYLTHIARESRVSLDYKMTFHNFDENEPVPSEDEQADFDVQTMSINFRHAFNPKLLGDFAVGYSMTSSDDSGIDEDTALTAQVRITRTLRTGQIVLGYLRGFTSGAGEGGSVIADTFTLSASAHVTPKITTSLEANVSFFDFRQEGGDDRYFWTIRPALTYQMLRFWNFVLSYDVASTQFDNPDEADRLDQRLRFTSRFILRDQLFLDLTYRYASRKFSGGDELSGGAEFDRNQIFLMLTYAPSFFL